MDYSKLSDFEINKLVAIATGHKQFSSLGWQGLQEGDFSAVIVRGPRKIGGFDPCNDPADAWPIISENRISIFFDETDPEYEGEPYQWCSATSTCQTHQVQYLSNPLRAAMIVFLMMQESK
ncbi:phage protein NinX family protein [Klebsiella oxytoca]|uniref:phage protein NinX family protein n=1 Tax=Klebsiella oxytoca TaxID=571 RepID=UPI001CCE5978|nr:phage protein NinX family protein [Klebsiella oxytoca]MBZ7725587.1 DUF2591 domain-containing protein [Klebsiella oxytoca]UWC76444.1 DUF2591 domain-containing protein [Klebsiella oxytoca]HED1534297.1 DUF2591 domain-containing protein [Klebsiella oxytoca]HED2240334.1 DUF2591 domain-containing protein [Klebsiella oxytoca]HED2307453.1 DUF2591 domain-containing protein [Klebsiella oxytoca]